MKIFDSKYVKELLILALPILMGNLGMILIGAGDCFVAGRYSTHALAAISIATSIHATVCVLGMGLLISISPILANIRGSKNSAKKYFYPTIRFSMFVAFVLMMVSIAYIPFLKYLGYEPSLLHDIKVYTLVISFSTYGMFLHLAVKEFLQSYEIVSFPNLITIAAVFFNVVLAYILAFGLFGFPSMGLLGLAVAAVIVRSIGGFILYLYCEYKFSFTNFHDKKYYKQLFKVGFPISIAMMIEFLSFNSMAILLGRIAGIYAAAQSVILTLANTAFMVPLGISNALAVKVGYANGAKNYKEMMAYIKNGLGMTVCFMLFASVIFATCARPLASIFTADKALIAIIVPAMYVVAAFQVSDGLQVSIAGIFEGLRRTKIVMIANLLTYFIIGVPFGYACALHFKAHLFAYWAAFSTSSYLLSSTLIVFLIINLRRIKHEFVIPK